MKHYIKLTAFLAVASVAIVVGRGVIKDRSAPNREHPYLGGYKSVAVAKKFYDLPSYVGTQTQGAASAPGSAKEVVVTTLVDKKGSSAPEGSLRWALQTLKGPRRITFAVEGIIFLEGSPLEIQNKIETIADYQAGKIGDEAMNNYVTIDATGKNVTITGNGMNLMNVHDIVVKNIRVRPGDDAAWGNNEFKAMGVKKMPSDAFNFEASKDILIEGGSFSFSADETVSGKYANNVTIKDCIIAMPLADPKLHGGDSHAFGSLIGCHNVHIHRCLYAHTRMRAPKVGPAEIAEGAGRAAVTNTVVYNYKDVGSQLTGQQVPVQHQWENNYYKQPTTMSQDPKRPKELVLWHLYKPGSKFYLNGNIGPNDPTGTNNWNMVLSKEAVYKEDPKGKLGSTARLFQYPAGIKILPAKQAYSEVLRTVGAMPRDCIDVRLIDSVVKGVGMTKNKAQEGALSKTSEIGGFDCLRKKYPAGTILDKNSSSKKSKSQSSKKKKKKK